jgi:hypothetical protein
MVGVAAAAYVVGRRNPPRTLFVPADRLADVEARLAELERRTGLVPVARMGKLYTVFHYEALASELAYERQLADLDERITEIERTNEASPVVWSAVNRNGRTAGDRGHA